MAELCPRAVLPKGGPLTGSKEGPIREREQNGPLGCGRSHRAIDPPCSDRSIGPAMRWGWPTAVMADPSPSQKSTCRSDGVLGPTVTGQPAEAHEKYKPGSKGVVRSFGSPALSMSLPASSGLYEIRGFPPAPHDAFGLSGIQPVSAIKLIGLRPPRLVDELGTGTTYPPGGKLVQWGPAGSQENIGPSAKKSYGARRSRDDRPVGPRLKA